MSRLDSPAAVFVSTPGFVRPVHFVFLDFDGDELRANDSGMNITITGQPQPDLDGTYNGVTGEFTDLSPIKIGAGGSSTVTAKISGLQGIDADVLALIGDESKWKGRMARVWRIVWDQNNLAQGTYQHYYTGYMVDCMLSGSTAEQTIEITIESYLAAFSQASNRTYLNQREYDPGDASGEATVATMNGGTSGGATGVGSGGGGSGGYEGGGAFGGGVMERFSGQQFN